MTCTFRRQYWKVSYDSCLNLCWPMNSMITLFASSVCITWYISSMTYHSVCVYYMYRMVYQFYDISQCLCLLYVSHGISVLWYVHSLLRSFYISEPFQLHFIDQRLTACIAHCRQRPSYLPNHSVFSCWLNRNNYQCVIMCTTFASWQGMKWYEFDMKWYPVLAFICKRCKQ